MTLTAAQEEIVRRFVAGESPHHIAAPDPGGVTDKFTFSEVCAALRAALAEQAAEIERLTRCLDHARSDHEKRARHL